MTNEQSIDRDSSRMIESFDDNDILEFIKLPPEIANIVKCYDDGSKWAIAKMSYSLKQLPDDILAIIKEYGHIAAFGNYWNVICDLNSFYKEIQLWLEDHTPAYRICGHCAAYVQILRPLNLICSCESKYPTQPYRKGKYGIFVEDKK